jgi:hypothetical protein
MASIISVCNRALTKLGSNRITSLDDNTKAARVMSANYDAVRRAEIRSHRWSFAMARTQLPALAAAPVWGFARAFQLPADNLRLDFIDSFYLWDWVGYDGFYRGFTGGSTTPFAVEGGQILTDISAPLNVRYARDITDPNVFDAAFAESLACKLAMEACEDLTQSSTKFQQVATEYADAIKTAKAVNAIERPPERLAESDWIIARI